MLTERAPRLGRAVAVQLALLAVLAIGSELPWVKKAHAEQVDPPKPVEPPKPAERRLRVIHLPPPEKPPEQQKTSEKLAKAEPPKAKPPEPQKPPGPEPEPQKTSEMSEPIKPQPPVATKPPPPKRIAKAEPAPALKPEPAEPPKPVQHQVIAADATAVHGVRLHVLIPRTASDLASHLRNSGGCMVVSRLAGDGAEVMSMLSLHGGSARLESGSPCDGVPRLVRDSAVNAALGDPLGQARAQHPEDGGDLVLQVLLTPRLHEQAQETLRRRFGDVSEEEMGQKAAESGYELTCFAEPSGSVRCQ
jgi:hypothetical protein